MTKSEYQELVEFIAPRFDRIDNRFDGIDERFDAIDERFSGFDERLRRVEILGEENRRQIQIVSEAVSDSKFVLCLSHADSCLDSTNTAGASCT